MKTIALWLYSIAFLLSAVLGGLDGLMYLFPCLALVVTLVVGLATLFLALYNSSKMARGAPRDEHKRWIL